MNKASARDRIPDSASTLFAEKGYDGASIDLIAQNSGLKGPSLYKHSRANAKYTAMPFYKALGFVPTDSLQTVNGIDFTPMKYTP